MIPAEQYEGPTSPSPLAGRDCLTLAEFTPAEVHRILDEALKLKMLRRSRIPFRPLFGKTLAMVFQKPSNRTRVSFEVGMYQLGGHALPHEELEELAGAADVPVINGLSDSHHPCQALADLLTVREELGGLEGVKITYVGDGNNVAHSLALGCALTGAELTIAHPPAHGPDPKIVELAAKLGDASTLTQDPQEGVADARVVYTDVWASMGQEAEAEERKMQFMPYQVNEELMSHAAPEAIFLHCLPAHRGEEVTARVIDGPQSRVFDQAENRLHAQKALLYLLLG